MGWSMKRKKDREKLAGRIRSIIHNSGLSLPEFARRTGVSKNTLVNYRDAVTSPPADFLLVLCEEFHVEAEWLLSGTGTPFQRQAGLPAGTGEDRPVFVPLLESRVTAGMDGRLLHQEVAEYYPFTSSWVERILGRQGESGKDFFLIRVRGDSMSPTINQGETAFVDAREEERRHVLPGRIYLVILPDGSTALKRLVLGRDGESLKLTCLSDNTVDYRPFEFAIDPPKGLMNHVLGRIRWVGREFE